MNIKTEVSVREFISSLINSFSKLSHLISNSFKSFFNFERFQVLMHAINNQFSQVRK